MIELPESSILAKQIESTCMHKKIERVIVNHSPHKFAFFTGDANLYPLYLEGKKLTAVRSFGGQVELEFEDMKLDFTDGASPRYVRPGEKDPLKHQLLIRFDDQSSIFVTIAMYGMMYLYSQPEEINPYTKMALVKPSPLSDAFTQEYFDQIVAECPDGMSAKGILATQQHIPGLGNGVLQDILFNAEVHPKHKKANLSADQIDLLYRSIKETLTRMVDLGGRVTEKDFFGNNGGYVPILYAKTAGHPCPACGATIAKEAYMGGSITFCPRCQK